MRRASDLEFRPDGSARLGVHCARLALSMQRATPGKRFVFLVDDERQ